MARQGLILWLTAIKYQGANIGSDTEFSITINGETTPIHTDLGHGAARLYSKPLFMHAAKGDEVTVSVVAKVSEDDLVDDVGLGQKDYIIALGNGRQKLDPLAVGVQENRGMFGKGGTASFVFEFEAEYFPCEQRGIRYVAGGDGGWLVTRAEDRKSKEFSLRFRWGVAQ